MKSLHYILELEEDTALPSPGGRRGGGGGSLDFVPGACLLGVAARAYDSAPAALRWDLFHSGRVRYGDALPVLRDDAAESAPAPLCMYLPKGTRAEGWTGDWINFLRQSDAARGEVQSEVRQVLVAPDGAAVRPALATALRTAVGYVSGTASDGQLFQLDALPAGTRLRGRIDVDCDAADQVVDFLQRRLAGTIHLGRRKNAGLGRATLRFVGPPAVDWTVVDEPAAVAPVGDYAGVRGGLVHLWFLGDTCLVDPDTGAPTLDVRAAHFGLDAARHRLVRRDTFTRLLRYTPFNLHRHRPDIERLTVKAGSVVTFDGFADTAEIRALRARVAAGVGLHRADGLGRVLVQPAVLVKGAAALAAPPPKAAERAVAPSPLPADDRLGAWLRDREAAVTGRVRARQIAEEGFERLARYTSARRDLPGPSQWSQVAGVARGAMGASNPRSALLHALFHEPSGDLDRREAVRAGVRQSRGALRRGAAARRWFREDDSGPGRALEQWLRDDARWADAEALAPLALGLLADRMAKTIQGGGPRGGER